MTAVLSPLPVQRFVDNLGLPLVGGKLFTYKAGTSTKQATFTDSSGGVSNTNPIILNFRGEAQVWLDPTLLYKFVLARSTDTDPPTNPIWTVDNINTFGIGFNFDNFAVDTGSVNAISVAIGSISSPVAFTRIVVKVANTNTGATTISINGGTAKAVSLENLAVLTGGELLASGIYQFIFDGAEWLLQSPALQPPQLRTATEIAGGIMPVNFFYPTTPALNVLRYSGVIADGVTDCTTPLLTAMNAIGAASSVGVLFVIPPNVVYDTKTLLTSLNSKVLIIENSVINDYTGAGQSSKRIGGTSADTSTNDSSLYWASGHHPGLTLNNFGTSGTSSATSRVASVDWMAGQFRNGGLTKRGSRYAAHNTWSKDGNVWAWQLISDAPWLAIVAEYELWSAGMAVTSGVTYCVNSGHIYVSAVTGSASATPPTHTSGTANGWTWSDDVGRNVYRIDENGRTLYGSGSYTYQWNYYGVARDADGGQVAVNWQAAGISKNVHHRLTPTDAAGNASLQPYWESQDGVGMRFFNAAKTREFIRATSTDLRFPDTQISGCASATAPDPGNNGTINTANILVARVQPTANQTGWILQAGTVDNQLVFVQNNSAFTGTFAAAATSNVADGATSAIPALTCRWFQWGSAAGRWFRAA